MVFPSNNIPANMRSNSLLVPAAVTRLDSLKTLTTDDLAQLGQLTYPYIRRRGESGFQRLTWEEALPIAGRGLSKIPGKKLAFLAGPQIGSDEDIYAFCKWAYASGSTNLDAWGQESWRASARALFDTMGTTDSTVIPEDLLSADTIFLWGTNPSEWSDEMVKLLVGARSRGAWVLLIHPAISHPNQRKWSWSRLKNKPRVSSLIDAQISLRPEGKVAFPVALLTQWAQKRREATSFIEEHTTAWSELQADLSNRNIGTLLDDAGVTHGSFKRVFERLLKARNWISVLGSDFCAPPHGTDATQALLNLHLAAGAVGHRGAGILNMAGSPTSAAMARFGLDPERGPNGVLNTPKNQTYWSDTWGFPLNLEPGLTALQSIQSAHSGELDALVCLGAMNVPSRLEQQQGPGPALRVHLASHMDRSMLLPAETTVVFPIFPAGLNHGTSIYSTAFRFIQFHKQERPIPINARSCWRTVGDLATHGHPALSGHLRFSSAQAIRAELAENFTSHHGVDAEPPPRWLQWQSTVTGGEFLGLPDGKARFRVVNPEIPSRGRQRVAVHSLGEASPTQRIILLSETDGQRFGISENQEITLKSPHGHLTAPVRFGPVRHGCVWAHQADQLDDPSWPDTPGWRVAHLKTPEVTS